MTLKAITTKRAARSGLSAAILATFALGLLALASPVEAAWNQPVGGASPINQANNRGAYQPSMAEIGGVPYVAWAEDDGTNFEIRVARLNASGTAWEQVVGGASPINQASNMSAAHPSLADIGGVPYVAWRESDGTNVEIRVARLNAAGTAWEQVVGGASPINQGNDKAADEPSLASIGGVPYVAWSESDGTNYEIRVSRLNAAGTAWEQTGPGALSPVNHASNRDAYAPSLTSIGGVPYVAWGEEDTMNSEIRVARLNAATGFWDEVVGGASPINQADEEAGDPSLTSIAGVPYVAWSEYDGTSTDEIRVARLNPSGTAWAQVVGGVSPINQANNRDAFEPRMEIFGGVPYVAWSETDGTNIEIRVSRLNAAGTAWEQVVGGASPINQANDRSAEQPSLTSIGGVPYVAWRESDGTNPEIRVSRLEPEFLGPASASATDTGATLSVDVKTYSLPYQVGFDYGPGFGSQTATTQTSGETETVTQSIDGLSPSTAYSFRPFATAGVPLPRVLGGEQAFTTQESPPPPPDATPPALDLAGKKAQRLGAFVAVIASCPTEACNLGATGTLVVPAGSAPQSEQKLRRLKLRPASAQLAAGGRTTLKLRIPRKSRNAAATVLDQGGRVSAKIVVSATDTAGNQSTARRAVRLVAEG